MKQIRMYFSAVALAGLLFVGCNGQKADPTITTLTLLQEMTDRDAPALYPDPAYKSASFSSYDRTSLSKTENWYGNGDNNWFLGHFQNGDRTEFILFDADGPGAITRWWMTFAGKGGSGTMRIYIDNADEPVLEANPFDLLSGNALAHSPVAGSISVLTEVEHRGHDLFYPIPYSSHCRITYSSDNIQSDGDMHIVGDECVYYNIEYRTYAEGTKVESFSKETIARYSEQEEKVAAMLNDPCKTVKAPKKSLDCTLEPGESHELSLKGPAAIREIRMQLDAEDINQALRSTVLEINFDGESTVFIPVGEFFGIGYKQLYTRMWYVNANPDNGEMTSRWVMPFSDNAVIRLANYGSQKVHIHDAHASVSKWNFDERSMYFHAMWKYYPKLDTRIDPVTGITDSIYDLNFVTIDGKGVYMGDSMCIFDKSAGWWGEGDEKVYIDGATFPDFFGTGSEDYYGYAWCHPNTIVDHPFTSQPCGEGNLAPGYTFNSRHRSLDRIAFENSLVFDMELFHWNKSTMDLGVSTYFYTLPGSIVRNERDTEGVKARTSTRILDLMDLSEDLMDIEAEFLSVDSISEGKYEAQSALGHIWSNASQAFWSFVPVGSEMVLSFESPYEGSYDLKMLYAFSWDYGCCDVWFNDRQLESGRNFNDKKVHTAWTGYGPVEVVKGKNIIKVKTVSANPGYDKCFFGLDRITLEKNK